MNQILCHVNDKVVGNALITHVSSTQDPNTGKIDALWLLPTCLSLTGGVYHRNISCVHSSLDFFVNWIIGGSWKHVRKKSIRFLMWWRLDWRINQEGVHEGDNFSICSRRGTIPVVFGRRNCWENRESNHLPCCSLWCMFNQLFFIKLHSYWSCSSLLLRKNQQEDLTQISMRNVAAL